MQHWALFSNQLFARGGGGGSGSGGGGGGIIMVGYLPMHALGAWFRRIHKKNEALFVAMQIVGWLTTLVYAVLLIVFLRGLGFLMAIGAPLGMGMGLYGWLGKLTQSKKTKAALMAAAAQDGAWDEAKLTARASDVFMQFQKDWSDFDTEAMKAYMTPSYQYHNALMLYSLQLAGRRNIVGNPQLNQVTVVGVDDSSDNSKDTVVIGIQAQAHDQLIDTSDNKTLFTDNHPFTEFWLFQRDTDGWRLDGIQQATASNWQRNSSLEQFATQNGYYFSLDMGWLMLPKRGQLFGDGKFGTSDINNHVIGLHNH
ncbi:MAG: TIM44-like domain-containing protein, partial [Candidatus Saccharimonadales bacterium]